MTTTQKQDRVSLHRVREMYLVVNGAHSMTAADDAYVRNNFIEIPDAADYSRDEILTLMAEGRLPLPAYLLSDGTPMVHPDFLEPVRQAGSVATLQKWFIDQWPATDQPAAREEWSEGYLSGQYVCLWSVTPATIQAKTRAIEDIKTEIAALEVGQGSRGRLAAAVDRLDTLEPPFTPYDDLRFGRPTSRQVWIDDVRKEHLGDQ